MESQYYPDYIFFSTYFNRSIFFVGILILVLVHIIFYSEIIGKQQTKKIISNFVYDKKYIKIMINGYIISLYKYDKNK
jgi:hypothetical protein